MHPHNPVVPFKKGTVLKMKVQFSGYVLDYGTLWNSTRYDSYFTVTHHVCEKDTSLSELREELKKFFRNFSPVRVTIMDYDIVPQELIDQEALKKVLESADDQSE